MVRSPAAKIAGYMQEWLVRLVDAPLARNRVAAYHEFVPQITIKVVDVAVNAVERKVAEGIRIKQRKPQVNEEKGGMEEALNNLAHCLFSMR